MNKFLYLTIGLVMALSVNTGVAEAQTTVELVFEAVEELTGDSSSSGFSSNGIYGCEGAAYGSVGAQGPSGAHVPVFASATFDQVKLLTYKECLLDKIANSTRESLISKMIESFTKFANEGFDGNPIYITKTQGEENVRIADPVVDSFLRGSEIGAIHPEFQNEVRIALARDYAARTRHSESRLQCGLSSAELNSIREGSGLRLFASFISQPQCSPTRALEIAKSILYEEKIAGSIEDERSKTYNGIRSLTETTTTDIGNGQTRTSRRVVTPGFLIAEQLSQIFGTGLRQTENADEVDEIITTLMSNIGTQILTDVKGLSGLTTSFGGQASYINRLVEGSKNRAQGNLVGGAASIINSTIANESEYIQARQQAAGVLNNASRQLETWENTCWDGILDKAEGDLVARIESRVCPSSNEVCNVPVQTSRTTSANAIYVGIASTDSVRVRGRVQNANSTVEVTASLNGVTVTEDAVVSSSGSWEVASLNLSTLEDGNIVINSVESLPAGSGVLAPLTATVVKVSSVTGVELTTPTTSPSITITATASSYVESVTIETNNTNSAAVIASNIASNMDVLRQKISEAANALNVLTQLGNALASTTTAAGQRAILEHLDRLISSGVLHSATDLREARSEAVELETLMQQTLEATRTTWQAGWCDPDNWEDYTI